MLAVIESSHYLTEQTWQDLHMDSLLGEPLQVKSFLMHPCNRAELLARQLIFAAIRDSEDDSAYKSMVACRGALFTLRRSLDIWRDAKTFIEQTYLFVEVLRAYLAARQSLKAFHGGGRLWYAQAQYYTEQGTI